MNHLFVLPFDHRSGFDHELLGYPYPPVTAVQKRAVEQMKRIVYDGFLAVWTSDPHKEELLILVDEEFGVSILRDAKREKITFAQTVEKSGQESFDFQYGSAFGKHLLALHPAYAKALVRYDVANTKDNIIQRNRLQKLSTFCARHGMGFMLEVLLTGKGSREKQMKRMMQEMLAAGITPTLWKLEGLASASSWKRLAKIAKAPMIVLGRNGTKREVTHWLRVAAASKVVSGFAVGRTIFFPPLKVYRDKKIPRAEAVRRIAHSYRDFIRLFRSYDASNR